MKLTRGYLVQTAEAKPLLDIFGLMPGEELEVHVNLFRMEEFTIGYLLVLPEFPSLAIH